MSFPISVVPAEVVKLLCRTLMNELSKPQTNAMTVENTFSAVHKNVSDSFHIIITDKPVADSSLRGLMEMRKTHNNCANV